MTNETNSLIEVSSIDVNELTSIERAPVELPAVVLYDAILGPHMAAPLEIEDEATQAAVRAASGISPISS